jgi:predicted Holliday junction resolvase-like endonuclease
MIFSENIVIVTLAVSIIAVLAVIIFFMKRTEDRIFFRISELEKDQSFLNQMHEIEKEIENKYSNQLNQRIMRSREALILDAVKRSKSVTKGKVIEHFAPFILDGWLNTDEVVFVGSPIDLISFSNIDSEKEVRIDFIEIKSGNSALSKKQKLIKEAIHSGRFFYREVRLKL